MQQVGGARKASHPVGVALKDGEVGVVVEGEVPDRVRVAVGRGAHHGVAVVGEAHAVCPVLLHVDRLGLPALG